MIDVKNSFRNGLDLDSDFLALQPDSYVDALNITIDAISANRDFAATNIVGNRIVNYGLPPGTNVCIGARGDNKENRVIYFVWNSYGKHSILQLSKTSRTVTKILENLTDTGFVDILQFSRYKKILHIEVIHRDEGDLLYWTDGNVSPKGLIIDKVAAGTYGTVELDFIEAAKTPPIQPAVVAYGDDSNRSTNGLRRKLYQLKYRWKYDDNSTSTWSPWSETPLPAGLVGTDNDSDATKNNFIATTIETGNKNVTAIDVAFRELGNNLWLDPLLTVTLNKEELGIADNTQYQYNFYNDNVPTVIDLRESLLLFDYFPLIAKSMVLANGNVLVYGAITEGYDRLGQDELDVEMTVTAIKNTGVSLGEPSLTYIQVTQTFTFTVGQNVPTGTVYTVFAFIPFIAPSTPPQVITLATYTSIAGDDAGDVAQAMFNYILANHASYAQAVGGVTFTANLPSGAYILQVVVTPGTGSTSIATGTGWPWYSRYRFGLVYFDSKGRTNGVMTYVNQPATDGDFEIETGAFELDAGIPKTPVINAEINHLPPSWATKYCWVRSNNLTFDKQLYYITNDFQSDTDYYYFGFENIKYYYDNNNKFIYSSIDAVVDPEKGDRIKIIAGATVAGYNGTIWSNEDYEILGVVERTLTGGADLGKFVKVKKPVAAESPVFQSSVAMLSLIYTPLQYSNISSDKTVYWEFSQFYDVTGGFHMGQLQNQTAIQPATFQFTNGDMYYRQRNMFNRVVPTVTSANFLLFDSNYSDFYPSAVNSNGRAEVIEVNAAQTYYPATVRYGQEFEPNTTVNNLPRFYPGNFKDYNRSFGGILKMWIINQYLFLGQELKIGSVPILLQIIKTVDQTGQLTASDELLNTVQYYIDEIGVGDCPEAVSYFNWSAYGIDNRRGRIWRWTNNGIHVISTLYNVNSWSSEELPLRDGATSFCYGAFDQKLNNYILAIEAATSSEAQTLTFAEGNDKAGDKPCFESFLSAKPEMMCTVGNLLVMFKDGNLYTHDSETYNNFFGTQYESYITPVFSKPGLQKKSWQSVNLISDGIWDAPEIYSNVMSHGSQRQQTNLIAAEFTIYEGMPSASIKRDTFSRGGKTNGGQMKGNWLAVKLRKQNASNLVFLNIVSVKFVDSPLTVT
jgi:hypothetical protein